MLLTGGMERVSHQKFKLVPLYYKPVLHLLEP